MGREGIHRSPGLIYAAKVTIKISSATSHNDSSFTANVIVKNITSSILPRIILEVELTWVSMPTGRLWMNIALLTIEMTMGAISRLDLWDTFYLASPLPH